MIFKVIEAEVGLSAETKPYADLDYSGYHKAESNNCFIIHCTKKNAVMFMLCTDGKQHKARELDVITLRTHAPRTLMT